MTRHASIWAIAVAVAVPLYYALSLGALERSLERAAAADDAQWQQGFRWEFDSRDDLAGPTPAGIARGRIADSSVAVPGAELSDFLSLNLRGQEIDARRFDRLSLSIHLDRAGPMLLFFRESLDGPDYRSPPLPLEAGWQELNLALNRLSWRSHLEGPGAGVQPWGGASATVASLRVHPVADGRSGFTIDWIAVEPSASAPEREVVAAGRTDAISILERREMPPVLALSDRWPRPASVMELRQRIERSWPATSVVLGSAGPAPAAKPWRVPAILALSLTLALLALAARRRRAPAAALSLGAILAAAGGLLLSPAQPTDRTTTVLMAWFALLVTAHATAALRDRGLALGSAAAWRQAALAGVAALLPLALLARGLTPVSPAEIIARGLTYLPWAAFQQLLLCAVLYRLLRRLPVPPAVAAAAAALLFGLGHFPNFELMLGTFVLAAGCLALNRRHRGIAPLAVLHATLGTAYLSLLPSQWLYSGAVGMRFLLG